MLKLLKRQQLTVVAIAMAILVAVLCIPAKFELRPHDGLKDIRERDFIQATMRLGPISFFEGAHGPTGFEYELMRQFTEHLNVSLSVNRADRLSDVFDALNQHESDIGAAALTFAKPNPNIRYTKPIIELQPLVVYRRGLTPVRSVEDLKGLKIGVIADTGNAQALHKLHEQIPHLSWQEASGIAAADLLRMTERGDLDAAVLYNKQFRLNRLFFPNVERGFNLGEPLSLVWTIAKDSPIELLNAANSFISQQQKNGQLAELSQRYFGHDEYLEYVGARLFIHHISNRLLTYIPYFKEAARETGFDWRLLAAVGYQESHWQPDAISPTGVQGLMMLTQPTAADLNIEDRLDPQSSVLGGARYLAQIYRRLDIEIEDPDRMWFALAAYNVGLGHLYDAQKITLQRGGNANRWEDVEKSLPLLQDGAWFPQTRYGYARGGEPVIYVRNIRRYYEILKYVNNSQQQFNRLGEEPTAPDLMTTFEIIAPKA